ncbi:hypothetical protein GCM10009753_18860 [Streptantibioticus ferralitis]|uniref:Secreted protein n=1 Tax=Streptantibioticus ferralitis TaxID=236510 RepID=A0ABT5YS54_9ACTN|nr:hypothetical protein [Streptantibioticus ferralitis]MDF2254330.1 hypothetical protein [Streptantibioticus ferralitis]
MSARSDDYSGRAPRVLRRALIGTAVLAVLIALAGLFAYATRDSRRPAKVPVSRSSSVSTAPSTPSSSASASAGRSTLPKPPATHDPIVLGKAAATALWTYDTRAYSQPQLLSALHAWMTSESNYADVASVNQQVPTTQLWEQMAQDRQYATATVNEAHFPASFTHALQADPGAITQAYIYAVTVTGKQSIAWNGAPHGGAEDRSTTLAVQCRPGKDCALVGVLPAVAP